MNRQHGESPAETMPETERRKYSEKDADTGTRNIDYRGGDKYVCTCLKLCWNIGGVRLPLNANYDQARLRARIALTMLLEKKLSPR